MNRYPSTEAMKVDLRARLASLAATLGSKQSAVDLVAKQGRVTSGVLLAFWRGYRDDPKGSTLDDILAQITKAEREAKKAA